MTKNNPKVSVIVPIYNVEAYIERCAISLFEQTLDNIEYIFVNDCTPDNSMMILSEVLSRYPQRKEQVRIINQPKNLGAAKAREDGIKEARGEYIIHCDSDDWVDKNMYLDMYRKAKSEDLDYVMCRSLYYTDGSSDTLIKDYIADDKWKFIEDILNCRTTVSLWNRLVKAEIMHQKDMCIPKGHMMEDKCYAVQIAYYAQSFGCVEGPYYHYLQRQNSVCGSLSDESLLNSFIQASVNMKFIEHFLEREGILRRYRKCMYISEFVVMGFLIPSLKRSNKNRKLWLTTFPQAVQHIWFSKHIAFSLKVISLLIILGIYPLIGKLK